MHFDGIAKDILRIKLLGLVVGSVVSGDVKGVVDGKPAEASEIFAEFAVLILHTNGEALAASVNEQSDVGENESVVGIVGAKFGGLDGLAVEENGNAWSDMSNSFA